MAKQKRPLTPEQQECMNRLGERIDRLYALFMQDEELLERVRQKQQKETA